MKNVLFVLNAVFKVTPNTAAAGQRALAALQRNEARVTDPRSTVVFGRGGDSGKLFGQGTSNATQSNGNFTQPYRTPLSRDLSQIRADRLWGCATYQITDD